MLSGNQKELMRQRSGGQKISVISHVDIENCPSSALCPLLTGSEHFEFAGNGGTLIIIRFGEEPFVRKSRSLFVFKPSGGHKGQISARDTLLDGIK